MRQLTVDGDRSLDGVAALLLTGGEDLHPSVYGETNRCCQRTNLARDKFELELLAVALERKLPVLAICRGMQLLCAALGGSLYQDLSEFRSARPAVKVILHRGPEHSDTAHPIRVEPKMVLSDVMGTDATLVNSHHHQAVRTLPSCLRPSAFAPDGLIEATEGINDSFLVGVQWHPERWEHPSSSALISALLSAARRFGMEDHAGSRHRRKASRSSEVET